MLHAIDPPVKPHNDSQTTLETTQKTTKCLSHRNLIVPKGCPVLPQGKRLARKKCSEEAVGVSTGVEFYKKVGSSPSL